MQRRLVAAVIVGCWLRCRRRGDNECRRCSCITASGIKQTAQLFCALTGHGLSVKQWCTLGFAFRNDFGGNMQSALARVFRGHFSGHAWGGLGIHHCCSGYVGNRLNHGRCHCGRCIDRR